MFVFRPKARRACLKDHRQWHLLHDILEDKKFDVKKLTKIPKEFTIVINFKWTGGSRYAPDHVVNPNSIWASVIKFTHSTIISTMIFYNVDYITKQLFYDKNILKLFEIFYLSQYFFQLDMVFIADSQTGFCSGLLWKH